MGDKSAWVFVFGAAVVFWASMSAIVLSHEVRFPETQGGYLSEFITRLDEANRAGEEVRITGRTCASSCTIYLSADRLCIARQTKFKFHCTQINGKCTGPRFNRMVADRIGKLNPILSTWFMNGPAKTKRTSTITGAQLIDSFGARECT